MPERPILLKALLRQRHWQKYGAFCAEYDKAARRIDPDLVGTYPSRAQLHRWESGSLRSLPYPDHCRVLEEMFPDWTAEQLFRPCPDGLIPRQRPGEDTTATGGPAKAQSEDGPPRLGSHADVSAVFVTRSEFASALPPHALFDGASEVRAAGLSLNLLCHQYPDQQLWKLVDDGARIQCLFLDPDGSSTKAREQEEGHPPGHLSALTKLNIQVLLRVRDRLSPERREGLQIAVYDETIRFNIILVDDTTCVVQPYLPEARGVDSPTFLIERNPDGGGLYPVFDQVFTSLWERGRPI